MNQLSTRVERKPPRTRWAVCLCALLAFASVGLFAPGDAEAHGGGFIPPPEPDPPPPPPPPPEAYGPPARPRPSPVPILPPPGAPTTPPPTPGMPPPPQQPPGVPPANTPPPTPPTGTPPTTTPGQPTGARRPPIRKPLRKRGGRTESADSETSWQTWWTMNRLAFLPDRTAGLRYAAVTPGERKAEPKTVWAEQRVAAAEGQVVPLLLRVLEPGTKARPEVVASALIALGKTSKTGEAKEVFLRHLLDDGQPMVVRESAALGIGLLTRSRPELQRDAAELDELRDALLAAYDDGDVPYQTRVFATLALGLLGGQPHTEPYAKDGRLVTRALWLRLAQDEPHRGVTVGLLTALGMQHPGGVPSAVRDGLRAIVSGRRVLGRRWDSSERSHALTAALRIGGPGAYAMLRRTIARRREHADVRRAAYVAVGHLAEGLTTEERQEIAAATWEALRYDRDPLTSGLGQLALGHLLGADLRDGSLRVMGGSAAETELLKQARNGATPTRGFSALALALAVRGVDPDTPGAEVFVKDAHAVLVEALRQGRGDDRLRGAYAVAVGLADVKEAADVLMGIVEDRHSDPQLRGHAAVSLGQVAARGPAVQRALFVALSQKRYAELRRQAALGLAFLGGRVVRTRLIQELESGKTEQLLAQVVIALGRLGDLQAVAPLVAVASDAKRSELSQALAVVALGMLADPEPRPSLLRLTRDANYPARTRSLHEAYTIL